MSAGTSASSAARGRLVIGPDQEGLAHMRDVEQAGVLARPVMLGEDAGRVLHRHVVAGEGHHAGAERHMLAHERRLEQRLRRLRCRPSSSRVGSGQPSASPSNRAGPDEARVRAPSVLRPERFPDPAGAGRLLPSVGEALQASPLSRAPAPARSFGLSVSGAVAPSAPACALNGRAGLSRGDQRQAHRGRTFNSMERAGVLNSYRHQGGLRRVVATARAWKRFRLQARPRRF